MIRPSPVLLIEPSVFQDLVQCSGWDISVPVDRHNDGYTSFSQDVMAAVNPYDYEPLILQSSQKLFA